MVHRIKFNTSYIKNQKTREINKSKNKNKNKIKNKNKNKNQNKNQNIFNITNTNLDSES